jgi:hypothetical protein
MNPEKLYYDVIMSNISNQNVKPIPAEYSEARNQAYLQNPSEYWLSVLKLTADTQSLPIWRCQIQTGSTDPNLSVYSITLTYGGQSFQAFLNYQSQNQGIVTPPPPSVNGGQQNNSTSYYDVYNYQYLPYLFNQTFIEAFAGLDALVGGLPTSNPPVMTYDITNQIAIIYADSSAYNGSDTIGSIGIFFNSATANLFSSFPLFIKNLTSTNGQNFELQTTLFADTNLGLYPPVVPTGSTITQYNCYTIYQETSTVQQWNPITAIVLTSTSIPVLPNNTSGVLTLNDIKNATSTIPVNNSSNTLAIPILTDYSTEGLYKNFLYYVPTSEYRRLQLYGSSPLTSLDLQVYWRDRLGALNTFLLTSNTTVCVKLLFEKKNYITNK